ncbi:MAG: internal scaffolding protein [Microvirus sp.]|nr:MAG: internal scaffolding protein [Microvirus sp.]
MRYYGTNSDGEMLSSAYVEKDGNNPAFNLDCSDLPSLTRQEFAEECDINVLMSRFEKTGLIDNLNRGEPRYLDVSDVPDMHQAMHILQTATDAFMSLPATVRRDFDNDPIKFVDFCENPENLPKLREWKLAPPAPLEPGPQKVEVVNPPPPKDAPASI